MPIARRTPRRMLLGAIPVAGAAAAAPALAAAPMQGGVRTRDGTSLFLRDWGGQGAPVVFVASWSLPSDIWAYQMMPLAEAGLRPVAYDRRGHGRSADPGRGYDLDTLADDLAAVIEALDLRGATLVGHSMGAAEVVRCVTRHGAAGRIARIVLVGPTTPMLARAPDNPDGVDPAIFESFRRDALMVDFPGWIDANMAPFVTPETPQGLRGWVRGMALTASLQALVACHRTLAAADLRAEMRAIGLPALVVQGDNDQTCPLELTGRRSAALLPRGQLLVYQGAPHGLVVTHRARLAGDILAFAREA